MTRFVATLLLLFALLLLQGNGARAQEATPAPGCDVAPRSEDELATLNANASPVARATPMTTNPIAPPEGEPVDAATLNALDETLAEVVACAQAGDVARLLALYSDDYVATIALAPEPVPIVPGQGHDHDHVPSGVETPEPELHVTPRVETAVRLPDGRIAAVVSAEGLEGTREIVIFAEEDGRWVIDEIHEALPEGPIGGELPFPVQAAVASAAAEFGVNIEAVTVVSHEKVEWPDTSLGCPKEGEMYAAVITPGYKVILSVNDQELEYHTDEFDRAIRCDPE
jgi:ketosteroid isomerase-like protein